MHACLLAAKGGVSGFLLFLLFSRTKKKESEKKREKDTKNQMRFPRFYDICGWDGGFEK